MTNVVYVWHAALNADRDLLPFYPGDKYVDIFASSFYSTDQVSRTIIFAREAHKRKKLFAIYESGLPGKSWNQYFTTLFRLVETTDVVLLCYNNFGDDFQDHCKKVGSNQGQSFFGNSQMDRMPRQVQLEWGKKMHEPRFKLVLRP